MAKKMKKALARLEARRQREKEPKQQFRFGRKVPGSMKK